MRKRDPEALLVLRAELERDLAALEKIVKENLQAVQRIEQGARESLDYAALGYTIHNVYCLMENSFLRIAKFYENSLEKESWHRDLLWRMTLNIPGFRPALLNEETASLIDELRSFRHVFRNLYQIGIKPEKVMAVQSLVPEAVERFREAVEQYINRLNILVEEEE